MVVKIFSIYDSKVEAFMQPFFMASKGAALRAFTELVNDKTTTISKNPEDYTLFEIGSFDDANGQVDKVITPVSLGIAIEFIK